MAVMTEEWAREILGDTIQPDGKLDACATWGEGSINFERYSAFLNGYFGAEVLEAIAWWMRNKAAGR